MEPRCVYIWVNDTTHEPFYVGCGTHKRIRKTNKSNRTKSFSEVFENNKCHYVILKDDLSPEDAAELERQVISDYRSQGCNLVNKTNGGEIRQYSLWTDEMRAEYASRLTGKNNPNYGNSWNEEQKQHLSKVRIETGIAKGALNPRAKKVMCVETGKIYDYQEQAAHELGLKGCGSIIHALQKPHFVARGFHFVQGEDIYKLNSEEKRREWLENIAS